MGGIPLLAKGRKPFLTARRLCSGSDWFGRSPQLSAEATYQPGLLGIALLWWNCSGWFPGSLLLLQFLNLWRLEPVWHLQHDRVALWFSKVMEPLHFIMLPALTSDARAAIHSVHVYREDDSADVMACCTWSLHAHRKPEFSSAIRLFCGSVLLWHTFGWVRCCNNNCS